MLLEAALAIEIQNTNPKVGSELAMNYAHEVALQAARVDIDPWVFHGIIYVESRWTADVVRHEGDKTCSVGLGQINVRTCAKTEVRELRNPYINIAAISIFLQKIKKNCVNRCAGLSWLRAYNPGEPRYVGWVKAVVDKAHNRHDPAARPVPEVYPRMHVAWVSWQAVT